MLHVGTNGTVLSVFDLLRCPDAHTEWPGESSAGKFKHQSMNGVLDQSVLTLVILRFLSLSLTTYSDTECVIWGRLRDGMVTEGELWLSVISHCSTVYGWYGLCFAVCCSYDDLRNVIKTMRNHKKIKDMASVLTGNLWIFFHCLETKKAVCACQCHETWVNDAYFVPLCGGGGGEGFSERRNTFSYIKLCVKCFKAFFVYFVVCMLVHLNNHEHICRVPFHVKHAQLRWTGANTKHMHI